ncbi:MAG: 2Fe-2S iron-sulfur cluster-binding protein, partial [Solirubrobacteraceae bacterium]
MPGYTLRLRRYQPDTDRAFWESFTVTLPAHHSVLEGILQARDLQDGTIAIRCSCRSAICGSCGVRINGKPLLACRTH